MAVEGAGASWKKPRLSIVQATWAQSAAEGLLTVATIFGTPFLLRKIGTEAYGIFGIVTVLTGQLGFLSLGIGPAATRVVAQYRGGEDERRYLSGVWAAAILGLLAALAVGLLFGLLAPWAWRNALKTSPAVLGQALASVAPALVIAAAQPIYGALCGVLAGKEEFGFTSAMRLVHGALRLTAALVVTGQGGGVAAVLGAQAVLDVLVVAAAARAVGFRPVRPAGVSAVLREARVLLRVGIPFAIAGTLQALLSDTEKLAIGVSRSLLDFSYYSVPYNAVMRFTMVPTALLATLLPRLAALSAAGDVEGSAALARKATRILMLAMSAGLLPLIAITPELLGLWLGPEFAHHATRSTRILIVALLIYTNVYAPHAVIRARSHPVTLPIMYAAELAVYLVVMYLCIRAAGIVGAAAAWSVRAVLDALCHRYLAGRALGRRLGRPVVSWVPVLVLGGCGLMFELSPHIGPLARLGLSAAGAAALVWWLVEREDWNIFRRFLMPWRR